MQKMFLILCFSAIPLAAADVYNFSLLPPNGIVAGGAGSTVGSGYSNSESKQHALARHYKLELKSVPERYAKYTLRFSRPCTGRDSKRSV